MSWKNNLKSQLNMPNIAKIIWHDTKTEQKLKIDNGELYYHNKAFNKWKKARIIFETLNNDFAFATESYVLETGEILYSSTVENLKKMLIDFKKRNNIVYLDGVQL